MKSLNTPILILVLVGLVFGITFISMNTKSEPVTSTETNPTTKRPYEPPLRFFVLMARGDTRDPILRFWNHEFEVGTQGHYDYWFFNRNKSPVEIMAQSKSCTCSGAAVGLIPPNSWQQFLSGSIVNGLPILPIPTTYGPVLATALAQKITWQELLGVDSQGVIIPEGSEAQPQMGILRMTWTAKPPAEPRNLSATMVTTLPGTQPQSITLSAAISVVPAVRLYIPNNGRSNEIQLGDLSNSSQIRRDIFVYSSSRRLLDLTVGLSSSEPDPCIQISKPELLPETERLVIANDLQNQFRDLITPQCIYRITVQVNEQVEVTHGDKKVVKQLDLGPIDRWINITLGQETGNVDQSQRQQVHLVGMVRGDIRIQGGPDDNDRIDFGRTFPASEERSKEVQIIAMRKGLDMELVPDGQKPDFLQASFTPLEPLDGLPRWKLTVKIPAGKLFGSIPAQSAILLQTKDAEHRKIRIPVVAKTFGNPF